MAANKAQNQSPQGKHSPPPDANDEPAIAAEIVLGISRAVDGRWKVTLIERSGDTEPKITAKAWGAKREALANLTRLQAKLTQFLTRPFARALKTEVAS